MVSRFGNDSQEFRTVSAQMLNTFLMSMRGTPYLYYGDELGMTNMDMPNIEEYVDIDAKGKYQAALKSGEDLNAFMEVLNYSSRENGRTPMQWDTTKNAGFSTGTPWKKVNPNYKQINVAKQEQNPNSVLSHFKKMTEVRKNNPVLVYGDYELLIPEDEQVYAFKRSLGSENIKVLLNFSDKPATVNRIEKISKEQILINNYEDVNFNGNTLELYPYQAILVKIE